MTKFILITEVKKGNSSNKWWDIKPNGETTAEAFDSLEEANAALRKGVTKITGECGFFPLSDGEYEPMIDYCDDEKIALLSEIISNAVSDPDYSYENAQKLKVKEVDDADCYFAFVGTPEAIISLSWGQDLKTNIHNKENGKDGFYFNYSEYDEDTDETKSISLKIITVEC